jgi:LEA14-like dessication related protein
MEQLIQKPQVKFDGLNIADASLLAGTFNFNFTVTNPNPLNIRASRITYRLKLNGLNFATGILDHGITLPPRGAGRMTIPVHIDYLETFESVAEMMHRKSAAYMLSGDFRLGPLTIPYQAQGTFDLPKMPKIYLDSIRVEQLSILGARLRCRLNMENKNAFALMFNRLDYNLQLGGTSFARASATPQGPIAAKGQSGMDLVLDVSFADLGRTAYQILRGSSADYKLDGKLVMEKGSGGNKLVPFSLGGKVPFIK